MSVPFGHDPTIAERHTLAFLNMLDPSREWWEVRTFDDVVLDDGTKRKDPKLIKTFRMSRADFLASSSILAKLTALNKQGAGVFGTINCTDGKGKRAENVTAVTALFADTDGAPLEPLLGLRPHIVVESSPGNWHVYWLVADCPLDRFEPMQQSIAARFGTDSAVCDEGRVMRLPGFYHRKGEPQLVTFCPQHMTPSRAPYMLDDLMSGLGLTLTFSEKKRTERGATEQDKSYPPSSALKIIDHCPTLAHVAAAKDDVSEPLWRATLGVVKFTTEGEALCHEWSSRDPRYDAEETQDKMDRWTTDPTRCETFRSYLDAKCAGCSQSCTSPIQLGYDPNISAAGAKGEGVTLDQFRAYMPMHNYIFMPTREFWPAASVNARLNAVPLFDGDGMPLLDDKGKERKQNASVWLDQNRPVEQMTWAPGEPTLIDNRLVANGGWIEHKGATTFNLYRPPIPLLGGDAGKAGPWLDHIDKVFPDDAPQIAKWLAQRVQNPQVKINHALVLGGQQGIGKDTILEPVKRAIGPWNFEEASPTQILGRFNGFVKSVILRVSEARDLGDADRFQFYDHLKTYTAAPPDVLRVDEKHLREHHVLNCCGVIITTNHKTDGIFLPADDRRHFVAWSDREKGDFSTEYWNDLWRWYENGGYAHVAAYLASLDILSFDPKAPPPKTPAFWAIADANRAPEDSELAEALDRMGNPAAVTLSQIKKASSSNSDFYFWISDRKNRRAIPHRLEKCGYVPVRNEADKKDGQWKIGESRVTVYAQSTLSPKDRMSAATAMANDHGR